MEPFIRILHLEDDLLDVELVQAKLEEAGLTCRITAVQTRDEFEEALSKDGYDIILADFRLPKYDGMSALRLAQELRPDVPFVFVSGRMGEEAAIEGLKHGATDYVLKQNLLRLGPALERALQEAENRRERKRMVEDLQRSHNMLRAIIEAAPTAIIGLDLEGHVHSVWNPAAEKMLGWSAQEVMGRPLPTVPVDRREEFRGFREQIRSGKTLEGVEVSRQRRDGTPIDYSIYASPLHDTQGHIAGNIAVLVDISERKRTEEKLNQYRHHLEELVKERTVQLTDAIKQAEAANNAKSIFLANMSHEIRTPMNAIVGFANLALRTELTREQRDYLEKIRMSSNVLLEIINDILDSSKIEAGKLTTVKENFQLQDIIDDLADLFTDQVAEKEFEMNIAVEEKVPYALIGDAKRIKQVLTNLASNAVKFTQQGEILIKVACVQETKHSVVLSFEVKDTGIGISYENLENIFSAFYQVDGTTTRKYAGTGLGLAISKQLVETMDGKIQVKSEPGRGSSFSFTVPLEKQMEASEPAYVFDSDVQGLKSLVVDDNRSSRELFARMLARFGFEVEKAETGEEALEILKAAATTINPYQLVLMDLKMPGIDGLDASEKIRQDTMLAHLPIIMISGFMLDQDIRRGISIGINAFLIKPVKKSVLFDTVLEVLGKKAEDDAVIRDETALVDHLPAAQIRGVRVLLAEDNIINQEVVSKLLKAAGIIVDIVDNGKKALAAVKKMSYAAVLMDIQMPEMDGFTASREIRKYEAATSNQQRAISNEQPATRTPIIAMTAHAMRGDREKCLQAGMNDYLSKPIDPDRLITVLAGWIKPSIGATTDRHRDNSQKDAGLYLFPHLSGVNIQSGLQRLRGDAGLYKKLLKDFAAYTTDMAADIKTAIAANDMERARHLVHTLKGQAGNLSATRLQSAAGDLETVLKEAGTDAAVLSQIGLKVKNVEASLLQVLESVKRLEDLPEDEPEIPAGAKAEETMSASEIKPVLIELSKLLASNKTEAQDFMELVIEHLSSWNIDEEIRQLQMQVGKFDFENAQKTLKKIANAIGI